MKKIMLIFSMLITGIAANACPTCEVAQPRYLKGISHGSGPQSQWDLVIISVTAVIVLATLFFSIKFLVKPGEKSATHIKRFILNNE
ncbi:MAG: hypothetical protein ABIP79_13615 [Chitinophagaceae bacterium]